MAYVEQGGKLVWQAPDTPAQPTTTTQLNQQTGLLEKVPIQAEQLGKTPTPQVGEQPQSTADPYMAGLKQFQEQYKTIQGMSQNAHEAPYMDSQKALVQAEQGRMSQADELQKAYSHAGLPEQEKRLQDLNMQIAQMTASYDKGLVDIEGKVMPMQFIVGQQAQMQRMKAAEVGALTSIQQAMSGNIEMARNTAREAVALKFEDEQNRIDSLRTQLELNYDNFSRGEQKKADELNYILNQQEQAMSEEKQSQSAITSLALDLAQMGADSALVSKIFNAENPRQAIELAAKSGLFKTSPVSDWSKIGQTPGGEDMFVNKTTGDIKTASQLSPVQPSGQYAPGQDGGQCGVFMRNIYDGVRFGDSFSEKMQQSNVDVSKKEFQVGDIIIQKTRMPYGHVASVIAVDGNKLTLLESNWNNDEKIGQRTIAIDDTSISGAVRGKSFNQSFKGAEEQKPFDMKEYEGLREKVFGNQTTSAMAQTVVTDFDDVVKAVGSDTWKDTPAAMRMVLSRIPRDGNMFYEVAKSLESAKSNIGFDKLLEIKKSGAGLGNVTEKQLASLQSVLGLMEVGRDSSTLLFNVQRAQNMYKEIIQKTKDENNYFAEQYPQYSEPLGIDYNAQQTGNDFTSSAGNSFTVPITESSADQVTSQGGDIFILPY